MINTLIKTEHKPKVDLENLVNSIYLLPQWEKIKEFPLMRRRFFITKSFNVHLFRKFSSKNMLEKYSLRLDDNTDIASMDLKVYKDSVYIINIDAFSSGSFEEVVNKLVQVAAEKAIYNTTNKEVKINLSYSLIKQTRMRKILTSIGFVSEANQSQYEKELFGETFVLMADENQNLQRQIKQMPILINK